MPQCPKCGVTLAEEYGMVTCPSSQCRAIVFIDMDGIAYMGEEATVAAARAVDEAPISAIDGPAVESDHEPEPTPPFEIPAPFEFSTEESEQPAPAQAEEPPLDLAPQFETVESESESEAVADADVELNMDAILGYQDPVQTNSQGEPEDVSLDVTGYASSELSQAKDGPFLFRIFLSEIYSKDLRDSLREALEDSRFAWDADNLLSGIKNGALEIANLAPVKAVILINRIKHLPIKIRWEQNAVTSITES